MTSITRRDLPLSRASICVARDLDLANVAEFKASVWWALERKPALMLIDLSDCEFIDLSVIRALIELQEGLGDAGPTVFAVVAGQQPRRSLRLTAVDEIMLVFESMLDALHALDGAGHDGTAPASTSR